MLLRIAILGLAFAAAPSAFAQVDVQSEKSKCDRFDPIEKTVLIEGGVDGDTVTIRSRKGLYSVRMIGIDTPETHYFGHSQGESAELAKERLQEFLPVGKKVRLEFGPEICDKYGRVLAHIFVGKKHVNKEMVREGHAVNYCYFPSIEHCESLGKLAEKAIEKRLGMFSDPNMELPYNFRRRVSKRRANSFVGSIRSKEVYGPENQEKVPVGERVFFSDENMIKKPFHVVE